MDKEKIMVFDVETPNRRQDSICSIGIVYEDQNGEVKEFYSLVNPECDFDYANTAIHGITSQMVVDAPTFPQLWKTVSKFFSDYLVVGHNVRFDLSCIKKALHAHGIEAVNPFFADTLDIARAVMKGVKSHSLDSMCGYFDITLENHHNAIEDAGATAEIFCCLSESFNFDLNDFIKQYDFSDIEAKTRRKQLSFTDNTKYLQELQGIILGVMCDNLLTDDEIRAVKYWADTHRGLKGNFPYDRIYNTLEKVLEDNIITENERAELFSLFKSVINPIEADDTLVVLSADLSEKNIVLTGEFECLSRNDFENFLAEQGAIIKKSVTKHIDYLIVGDKGSDKWIYGNYGGKIKKAMEYNEKGAEILIIKESDFIALFDE